MLAIVDFQSQLFLMNVALVGGYHQLSWIISGNSIPNIAIKRSKDAVERVMEENWTRSEKLNLAQ